MNFARLASLALSVPVAAQGQVHVVDDGAFDYGALRLLDLHPDGTLETQLELGDLTAGLGEVLADGDAFGAAVVSLGDLDGNGALDLAVGVPGDEAGGRDRGAVWIVFRSPSGGIASRRLIRAQEGLAGELADGARFGSALAYLGDLDGDGMRELAVGAPGAGATAAGEVWILSLTADGRVGRERRIGLGLANFGGALASEDEFGCALAALGDRDGDGTPDLAVGARNDDDGTWEYWADYGALWLLHLGPDATVRTSRKISRTQGGFGSGLYTDAHFGASVCALGDVDGDGVLDLAVADDPWGTPGTAYGEVWILFLRADGTVRAKQRVDRSTGGLSNPSYDRFGSALAPLGDLDGDGTPDLAVGADRSAAGAVFTLFLQPAGTVRAQQILDGAALGLAAGDRLGAGLAALGDLDLDGRADVAAGTVGRDSVVTADFTRLQAAVDAAASGDTVLLRPTLGDYGDAVLGGAKSLTIVGDSTGAVWVRNIGVYGLAAEREVCLLHLEPREGAFDLSLNRGRVWIEGCRRRPSASVLSGPALTIFDSAEVVVLRSSLQGQDQEATPEWTDPAVWVMGASSVHAYDSSLLGARGECVGGWDHTWDCWRGGPGLLSEPGTTVSLTGCFVHGGDAYVQDPVVSMCVGSGPGIVAEGAVRARDSILEGGDGVSVYWGVCAQPSAPFIGNVQRLPGESLAFSTGPLAREGAELVFEFRGAPHAEVWLMGSPFARIAERPAQHGFLLLGTPRALEYMGRTDASGALDVPVPIGNLAPTWDVRRTFLQPLMIEGAHGHARERPSRVTLGAGSAFLVLDSSF